MNSKVQHRAARRARHPAALRISPVALACVSLLTATQLAQAQDAAAAQTVTVTGIRRGIESSVSVKRNADGIMEVISSEDLGKLPEVSIAESLARLPGLAGQAVGGRIQQIQIRGLSGDFAGTLLNGRQQVSTGDNRSVEFDQFPSELIGQVRIYKTPDAKIVGGGLSGTIDMRTVRPLDFGERAVALNVRGEKNSNGKLNANTSVTGNRLSASYIDQFADRTVGVALGFAHLDTPTQELHYKAWGFDTPSATRDCIKHPEWGCSPVQGIPTGATVQNGFEALATSRKQIRNGAMGVFEFKPSKDLHSTVDLYYSKFSKDESSRGLMGSIGDAWGGAPSMVFSNVQTRQVGTATLVNQATITGVGNMVVRNDLNTRDDKLKSAGWNTEYKIGDGWSTSADLSYSNAKRKENVIETYAGAFSGAAKALTNFEMSIPAGKGFPTFKPTNLDYTSVADIRLSDPAGWGHDGLWKKPQIDDTIKAVNLAGKKELGSVFSTLDFGLNYTKRDKSLEMNELATDLKNGRAPVSVPTEFQQRPTGLGFVGIPGVLAYDVLGALNSIYDLKPQALDQIFNRNYTVYEKVTTAYSQLGIDTDLASLPLRGNLGVQYIHTKQGSTGFSRLSGQDSDITRGTSYNDFLPSLNLVLELPSEINLRLGLAKTLARGRIDDMKAGANVSVSANSSGLTKWSGSGGNPELQPWRAKSADLSLEKYWGKRSYVSAAGFYKKLGTYIFKQRLPLDFSPFPNTSPLPTPLDPIGEFERPANGKGGELWGGEFTASLDAGTWSSTLDGFGVIGNISTISTNVRPDGPGTPNKLPGLSGTTSNLTFYYEKFGYSARISQRYRAAFRGEVTGLFNARSFEEIQASKQIDLQLGYEIQSGSMKGLSVLFQVNNLNNEPYVTRQGNGFGDVIAPATFNSFGRQFLFGVNYKL